MEARCQATATAMWVPSMRVRIAAGSSVASWNKGGRTGWSGADANLVEAFVEPVGADRLAGASAGQQREGGALVSDAGMTLTGGDQVKDETGERLGSTAGARPSSSPRFISRMTLHLALPVWCYRLPRPVLPARDTDRPVTPGSVDRRRDSRWRALGGTARVLLDLPHHSP
jgi:hypothetical protein